MHAQRDGAMGRNILLCWQTNAQKLRIGPKDCCQVQVTRLCRRMGQKVAPPRSIALRGSDEDPHNRGRFMIYSCPTGKKFEIFDQIFQASPHITILVLSHPEHEGGCQTRPCRRGSAQGLHLDNRPDRLFIVRRLCAPCWNARRRRGFVSRKKGSVPKSL